MPIHATPHSLFRSQVRELSAQLPAVRDGDDDAIHDARVATRRLRETLPLLDAAGPMREKARRRLRKTGRALGGIRDLDVMLELAVAAVKHLPAASVPLQHLLVELSAARDARLRRVVKRLEVGDRKSVLTGLGVDGRGFWRPPIRVAPHWRRVLAERILQRGDALELAIARAGGVHFPNRVHAVRIAAKKLRYALEVGEATGTVRVHGAVELLKRVQDVLGDLHDRHVFLQTVVERAADAGPEHAAAFDAVRAFLETECRDLHRRYLDERDDAASLGETMRAALRPRRAGYFLAPGAILLAAASALAVQPAVRRLRRAG